MALEVKCEFDSNGNIYLVAIKYIATKAVMKYMHIGDYDIDITKDNERDIIFDPIIPFDQIIKFVDDGIEFEAIRTRDPVLVGTSDEAKYFEKLVICSTSYDLIQQFIKKIVGLHEADKTKHKGDIMIYRWDSSFWVTLSSQKKRSLDTVYLDKDSKERIINDISKFLNSEDIYDKHGIPYKRSYLFRGPPGTGKTSFIYAIASHFKMNIGLYKYNTEKKPISHAIKTIPQNTILVIEDLQFAVPECKTKNVDFSEMLNAMDGIFIKNKLITFYTSNSVSEIPKVFLRPGRIDLDLILAYASESQIKNIYLSFFPKGDSDKFYDEIKSHKVTPAILQKFLFYDSIDDNNGDQKRPFKKMRELRECIESQSDSNDVQLNMVS